VDESDMINSEDESNESLYSGGNASFDVWNDSLVENKKASRSNEEKNKFLINFLEDIFKFLGKTKANIPIDEIMDSIPEIIIHIFDSENNKQKEIIVDKIKNDREFHNFFSLIWGYYTTSINSRKFLGITEATYNLIDKLNTNKP
jgi:hypothetical protein